jgi:hypothetical protein
MTSLKGFAILMGLLIPFVSLAGKLDDTEDLVSGRRSSRTSNDHRDDDDDDGGGILGLFRLLGGSDSEDSEEDEGSAASGHSVHADGPPRLGLVGLPWDDAAVPRNFGQEDGTLETGEKRELALRLSAGYQYDWDNVHLTDLSVRLESGIGIAASGRWTGFFEPLEGENRTDTMSLMDATILWDFINDSSFNLELGATLLAMTHAGTGHLGGGAQLRLDLFPARPFVMSVEMTAGGIQSAAYFRAGGSLGVVVRNVEIFAGYELQQFGLDDPIVFRGPRAGFRLWL